MNTFHYYRNVRHNIIRTFISHGIDVRAAITKVRINSPYLFATLAECQLEEQLNYRDGL
jgi:hypothetical protein